MSATDYRRAKLFAIDGKVGGLVVVVVGSRVGAFAGPAEILATSTVKDLTAGSGLAHG